MASAASTTSKMRVTRTTARGLSRLQEQEGGVLSWCDLPSDLYSQILRRLPSRRDRVRLSAVCRHWRVCAWQNLPRVCQILPMRVTKTVRGTHVLHVRGFSRLQEEQCGGGFVDSPAFAVAGLHWAIRYYPGSDGCDGERGHVGAFVRLLTEGVVVRGYVGLLLLDQTTGLAGTVIIWDRRRTRFDAARSCTRGTSKVAKRSELKGSRTHASSAATASR